MKYNKSPISMREGRVFLDGVEILDSVKCNITFSPDVWSGKQLGERASSNRWLGYTINGTITRRRSTNWIQNMVKQYRKNGKTPELTIQGIMNDKDSDYYTKHKNITVTAVGCVLTGDLNLIDLDSGGDVVDDTITFVAKDIL